VVPAAPRIETVDVEHKHEVNYHDIHRHASFARTVIQVSGGTHFLVVMSVQREKTSAVSPEGRRATTASQTHEMAAAQAACLRAADSIRLERAADAIPLIQAIAKAPASDSIKGDAERLLEQIATTLDRENLK
jgi:hypothetical protein